MECFNVRILPKLSHITVVKNTYWFLYLTLVVALIQGSRMSQDMSLRHMNSHKYSISEAFVFQDSGNSNQ